MRRTPRDLNARLSCFFKRTWFSFHNAPARDLSVESTAERDAVVSAFGCDNNRCSVVIAYNTTPPPDVPCLCPLVVSYPANGEGGKGTGAAGSHGRHRSDLPQ